MLLIWLYNNIDSIRLLIDGAMSASINNSIITGLGMFCFFLFFSMLSLTSILQLLKQQPTINILCYILIFIVSISFCLITLGLDFLGIIYIIVYAGAILVMFLSVFMLVSQRAEELKKAGKKAKMSDFDKKLNNLILNFVIVLYVLSSCYIWYNRLFSWDFYSEELKTQYSDLYLYFYKPVQVVAAKLYGEEVALMLVIGLIFLLVIIGAISLVLNDSNPDVNWKSAWTEKNLITKKNNKINMQKLYYEEDRSFGTWRRNPNGTYTLIDSWKRDRFTGEYKIGYQYFLKELWYKYK